MIIKILIKLIYLIQLAFLVMPIWILIMKNCLDGLVSKVFTNKEVK